MKHIARKRGWMAAVRPWILAPLVAAGCSTVKSSQPGDGFRTLGKDQPGDSWTDRLAAPFKGGADKIGSNRQATANDKDQLSLSNKVNKKNPELIVAVAQMSERAGKFDEAEKQYEKALKVAPKDLGALVGYAHLQDRRGNLEEATKLYQKAIAAHPKEAAAHNDLGLCYHRRGMLKESRQELASAVQLAPERKLYRNNLATVLVEQGQYTDALTQLTAAHGQAGGHYNLGYLLTKKGDQQTALSHFQQAATIDPTMVAAQKWVAKLGGPSSDEGPAMAGPALGPATTPSMAQRYETPATRYMPTVEAAPQPAPAPQYLQTNPAAAAPQDGQANPWAAPPSSVRYPTTQTSAYTGPGAVPPTPDQIR